MIFIVRLFCKRISSPPGLSPLDHLTVSWDKDVLYKSDALRALSDNIAKQH